MSDADLIEAFIRERGVTVCPPRTFALDATSGSGNWMTQRDARMRALKVLRSEAGVRRGQIAALVDLGKGRSEIAEVLGISPSTLDGDLAVLKRSGRIPDRPVVKRALGPRRKYNVSGKATTSEALAKRRETILTRMLAGETQRAIGKSMGVPLTTLHWDVRWLRAAGKL